VFAKLLGISLDVRPKVIRQRYYEMETIGKRKPVAFGVRFLGKGFTPDFGEKLEVSKEQVDH
jgi:hypothetical protein